MFYIKRNQLTNKVDKDKWAVLLIESKVLWELDCLFMPNNAAKSSTIKSKASASSEFFSQMFNNTDSIPNNWTTDVQAEVMVKDYIPAKYIKSIIVENSQAMNICKEKRSTDIEIIINKTFFGFRKNFISN